MSVQMNKVNVLDELRLLLTSPLHPHFKVALAGMLFSGKPEMSKRELSDVSGLHPADADNAGRQLRHHRLGYFRGATITLTDPAMLELMKDLGGALELLRKEESTAAKPAKVKAVKAVANV